MKKNEKSAFELAISSIVADAVTRATEAAKADFASRAAAMFGSVGGASAPATQPVKRARVCKVEGCRKAAKGPRFKWLCAEHFEEQKTNPPAAVAPTEKRKPGRPKKIVVASVEPAAVATVPAAAAPPAPAAVATAP